MAKIVTLDRTIKDAVRKKIKKYDKAIKEEVVKQAKKQGHNISTSNVKKIDLVKLDLQKEITDFKTGKMTFNKDELNLVLYSMVYDNNSDTTDEAVFEYKDTRTDTWSWQIKAGVTFEYKTEANIAELAKVGESVKIDFSASYGESYGKSKEWRWSATPQIPPRSKTVMHAILKQVAGKVPMFCTLIADGTVKCKAHIDYWGKHTRQFDIPLTRLMNVKERTYTTTGEIQGASGFDTLVKKEQLPLTVKEQKQLAPGVTKHELRSLSLQNLKLEA